ncbi:MAG: radical SAM family heme chaperone HemW [Bacilli bacterium]|nr:radical SAM family heme chaperone HemW [Bacilli bacterium]
MLAVYIHIPFCSSICTYCDFAKVYKNDNWIDKYLIELKKEIQESYKGEKIKTLYFGGGTPSVLSIKQLNYLFDIISILNIEKNAEITFECNPEDLTVEKLEFLKDKINRLSIGIESFNPKILKLLGRKKPDINNIILAKKYFHNINIDLMYGFNEITIDDFKDDIKKLLNLNVSHISAYNLIVEKNTKLYIDGYKIKDDTRFDKVLEDTLKKNGYEHYEISNYAKKGYESKHNLTYWNNEHYYGFGLGASGYIDNIRYDNTKNLNKYLSGNYRYQENIIDKNEKMQNEFILGLRKLKGISKKDFFKKYKMNIKNINIVQELLGKNFLLENDKYIYINPKYIYLSNEILVKFLDILY